jgi:hypothetical protein
MRSLLVCVGVLLLTASSRVFGQLVDQNKAPNTASEAISRPLASGSYPDADRRRTLGHRSQFVEQSDRVRSLPRHSSRTAAVSAQVHRPGGTGHGARRRLREHRGRSRHRRRSRRQLRLMPWTSARGSRLRRRRRHSSRQPRCTPLVPPWPERLMGCRNDGALRSRRPKYQPDRGHPSASRRGAGRPRRLRETLAAEPRCGDCVPRLARHFPARRHCVQSRSGRFGRGGVSTIPPRKHQVDRVFNKPSIVE